MGVAAWQNKRKRSGAEENEERRATVIRHGPAGKCAAAESQSQYFRSSRDWLEGETCKVRRRLWRQRCPLPKRTATEMVRGMGGKGGTPPR
ncbi:hypothetical protein CLOP_g23052 [Closterium sp. NIES-67]|nr:hypothetical protein CLOP_g23052 [Closterium sp. NIES-67]